VTLALPAAQAPAAIARLRTLAAVADVEQTPRTGNIVELTAFPKSGALLIEDVSALAVAEKWDVQELYAEAGRLDEVFRAVTTHDAARAREARA
jgi:ABC-2 type transport system ATP-binding protein